jgi:hypothetical protein
MPRTCLADYLVDSLDLTGRIGPDQQDGLSEAILIIGPSTCAVSGFVTARPMLQKAARIANYLGSVACRTTFSKVDTGTHPCQSNSFVSHGRRSGSSMAFSDRKIISTCDMTPK